MTEKLHGFFFRTRAGNRYYYDDCSGMVFTCPDGLEQALRLYKAGTSPGGHWEKFIRNRHRAYGAFRRPEQPAAFLPRPRPEELAKTVLHNGFRQLILTVTAQCNFRCRYCINSSHYPQTEETPSGTMSSQVARDALDYYFTNIARIRRHDPSRPAVVTFYGGEPLLQFDLIEKAVEYTRARGITNVLFTISTNGLLLDDAKADFLAANNFAVWVSLDGPPAEHDRNRIDAGGRPTFDRVFGNIERFWKRHPEHAMLGFLVTYDWRTDFRALSDFFADREEFRKTLFVVNPVKPNFSRYYETFTAEERELFFRRVGSLRQELYDNPGAHHRNPLLNFYFCAPYRLHLMRGIITPPGNAHIHSTSTCMPGDKICVLPNGSFQPCERVPGLATIGTAETGLRFEVIADLVADYNTRIAQHCGDCPIRRLCKACFATFWDGSTFRKPSADFCSTQLSWVQETVRDTYSLLEEQPDFFGEIMEFYQRKYSHLLSLHF